MVKLDWWNHLGVSPFFKAVFLLLFQLLEPSVPIGTVLAVFSEELFVFKGGFHIRLKPHSSCEVIFWFRCFIYLLRLLGSNEKVCLMKLYFQSLCFTVDDLFFFKLSKDNSNLQYSPCYISKVYVVLWIVLWKFKESIEQIFISL